MLGTLYRKQLHRQRIIGFFMQVIITALLVYTLWFGILNTSSLRIQLIGIATSILLLYVGVFWLGPIVRASQDPTYAVFDRRVYVRNQSDPWWRDTPVSERQMLTLFWYELDKWANHLGVPPLSNFLVLRIDSGMANHAPSDALDTIVLLLKELENQPELACVCAGLAQLRFQLEVASAVGAQFCFTHTGVWSGQYESLGLYLGVYSEPAGNTIL